MARVNSDGAEGTPQRRLAAILAADVVGYSQLMGADEEATRAALRALRAEIIDPALATHNGRLVKTTGDGLLVEFASVVDALRCALAWQKGVAQGNAGCQFASNRDPLFASNRDPSGCAGIGLSA